MINYKHLFLALNLVCWVAVAPVWAAMSPGEISDNPVVEQQARALFERVRCPVCTHQGLHDSEADLSKDMRVLIRRKLAAGDSPQQVEAWLRQTYGPDIFLDPGWGRHTYALWLIPSGVFLLAIFGWVAILRAKKRPTSKRRP